MNHPGLRLGLVLEGKSIPQWLSVAVQRVEADGHGMLNVIVVHDPDAFEAGRAFDSSHSSGNFVVRAYRRLERLYIALDPDAHVLSDVQPAFPSATLLRTVAIPGESQHGQSGRIMDHLRSYDLDIVLKLGPCIPDALYAGIARWGVWTVWHDDAEVGTVDDQGFWGVMTGRRVALLSVRQTDRACAESSTVNQAVLHVDRSSVGRSTNTFLWSAASMLIRSIARQAGLHQETGTPVIGHDQSVGATVEPPGIRAKRQCAAAVVIAKHLWNYARSKVRNLGTFEQWFLLETRGTEILPRSGRATAIVPPPDRFWADPTIVVEGNARHVFFEEFLFEKGRGHICASLLMDDGTLSPPQVVLDRPFHLSYPYIFKVRGDYYMIPESSRNMTIDLYKARAFPHDWEFARTLIDGIKAWDSTLHRYKGRWWLFAVVAELRGATGYDSLWLFSASDLSGSRWTPHPMNPIVADVRKARPAGRIFWDKGHMYRPSQDCSQRYGGSIRLNRIVELSEERYREVEVSHISSDENSGLYAVHTLNRSGDVTMLDGAARRWRLPMGFPLHRRSRKVEYQLKLEVSPIVERSSTG